MLWTIREEDGSLTTIDTDNKPEDGIMTMIVHTIIDIRMLLKSFGKDKGVPFMLENGDEREDFLVYGVPENSEDWPSVVEAIQAEDQVYKTML